MKCNLCSFHIIDIIILYSVVNSSKLMIMLFLSLTKTINVTREVSESLSVNYSFNYQKSWYMCTPTRISPLYQNTTFLSNIHDNVSWMIKSVRAIILFFLVLQYDFVSLSLVIIAYLFAHIFREYCTLYPIFSKIFLIYVLLDLQFSEQYCVDRCLSPCPFFLDIVLYIIPRLTASDNPFIFKLFLKLLSELKRTVFAHKSRLTTPRFIEVEVTSQENER